MIAECEDDLQNDEHAPDDDNLAQANMQDLIAKAGEAVPGAAKDGGSREIFERIQRVMLCNPLPSTCQFTVRIGNPPNYGKR